MRKIIVTCGRCKGSGTVPTWGKCPDCEGQGKYETVQLPVIAVDGKVVYKRSDYDFQS